MHKKSFFILRIGLAITFVWIGIMILQNPVAWSGFIQPWAAKLIPFPLNQFMQGTGVLDIVVGLLLLFDATVMIAALVGTLHLISVLIGSGVNTVTVRDIGLLAAIFSAFVESLPNKYKTHEQTN